MAYTKQAVNDLLGEVVKQMDISDEMFYDAQKEYKALGDWIDQESKIFKVAIYPQGSFALGTVVKPISGNDDYDLDLVCELAGQYGLSARELKIDVVKNWLIKYKRITGDIEEKRRCWHVEYEDLPYFHMDVIPAFSLEDDLSEPQGAINITDKNEGKNTYTYIGSNPKGYVDWFHARCQKRWDVLFESYSQEHHLLTEEATQERLDRHKIKTPLQKVIQILKRHRDVMFKDNQDDKPISIIITTLAASLYENEDNIVDTLGSFLNGAESYIDSHKENGKYVIENPSYAGENFADKWNTTHPERATAFFEWLHKAQEDFAFTEIRNLDRVQMGHLINESFGENTGKALYRTMALNETKAVSDKSLKVDTSTGNLSRNGSIAVPPSHHHGEEI